MLTAVSYLLTVGSIYRMSDTELDATSRPVLAALIAAGLVFALVAYIGALLWGVPPIPAALSWILGIAVPWAMDAANQDPTGLYQIGLLFLVVIMAVAATVIALTVAIVRSAVDRRRKRIPG